MKISTRTRYGLRAMFGLALAYGEGPLQIRAIAEREDISNKYLEQLVAVLKSAGLIRSTRGPKGGYVLVNPPAKVRLLEVFTALEGPIEPVECLEHESYCPRCANCVTRQVWADIQRSVTKVLQETTLQDLVDRAKKLADGNSTYHI
ncbi:MAG TPA: Rrf2 family transcriptional regulator [Sedimentisphaerales bacterium]|nr:Rrf2 family transcriptional regulator [Sedimentisphaerales bacterium]